MKTGYKSSRRLHSVRSPLENILWRPRTKRKRIIRSFGRQRMNVRASLERGARQHDLGQVSCELRNDLSCEAAFLAAKQEPIFSRSGRSGDDRLPARGITKRTHLIGIRTVVPRARPQSQNEPGLFRFWPRGPHAPARKLRLGVPGCLATPAGPLTKRTRAIRIFGRSGGLTVWHGPKTREPRARKHKGSVMPDAVERLKSPRGRRLT